MIGFRNRLAKEVLITNDTSLGNPDTQAGASTASKLQLVLIKSLVGFEAAFWKLGSNFFSWWSL